MRYICVMMDVESLFGQTTVEKAKKISIVTNIPTFEGEPLRSPIWILNQWIIWIR